MPLEQPVINMVCLILVYLCVFIYFYIGKNIIKTVLHFFCVFDEEFLNSSMVKSINLTFGVGF